MNALITLILSLLVIEHATARLESSHRILAKPFCGDGKCSGGETCSSCPGDCGCAVDETCTEGACVSGSGGSFCGDNTCDASEDCNSCSADCGACIFCGDGKCNGSEDCSSCSVDCGTCPPCPNCPLEGSSCLCTDGTTSCSSDQDCPEVTTLGTCLNGPRGGLTCNSNLDCPKGQSTTDCVGAATVVDEGSCHACTGVQVSWGLISGDINQCDEGYLCGDFSQNTNPVDCVSCLTGMTCDAWCNLDHLGHWVGKPLESHMANSNCAGGYGACTCTMSSDYSNSYSITTNTHAGAICDAHQFDQYEDCSDAGRCLTDFPYNGESNSPYCESLKVTSISGELDKTEYAPARPQFHLMTGSIPRLSQCGVLSVLKISTCMILVLMVMELELNHLYFFLVRLLVEKGGNGSYLLIVLVILFDCFSRPVLVKA